jgi:hypothetical protein
MAQSLIGQITETTANVTIQLTSAGSNRPNNFTVQITQWDTGSITTGSTRTIVTGLTRTQTSTINGGSLTVSPYYEIDGLGPMDYALITTASGDCHTSDVDQVLTTALSVYHPTRNGVVTEVTSYYNPQTIMYDFHGGGNYTTNTSYQDIATFTTLPFGNLGYYENYLLSGFEIQHVYSRDSNGNTINGDFYQGPLQTPVITNSTFYLDGQHFNIRGRQIGGITTLFPGPNVTRYKVTWTMSGNFGYVDFYWDANGNQ